MKAEDRKRLHDALDNIIDSNASFLLHLGVEGSDGRLKFLHFARGFSAEEKVYMDLKGLRTLCSRLATPVSLAMIPDLEENLRYLENISRTIPFYSRRCAHA